MGGITIHYALSADNEEKVRKIRDKWKEYAKELDLMRIKHRYEDIEGVGCVVKETIELSLEHFAVKTFADLKRRVDKGEIRILEKDPTLPEMMELADPGVRMIVMPRIFDTPWTQFLPLYTKDLSGWVVKWVYLSVFSVPCAKLPWITGTEGVHYVNVPVKGFVDTPETTETFSLYFAKLPKVWYTKNFIKTQAFTHEQGAPNSFVHMLIVDFFKDLERQRLVRKLYINDEGDYYKTGELKTLLESYGANMAVIRMITSELEKLGWKRQGHEAVYGA